MTPEDRKEQIKAATKLEELIGRDTELTGRRDDLRGRCPLHDGENPSSLSVNAEKQVFRCNSCGAEGDCFTYVMQKESLAFPQALEWLGEWTGIAKADPADDWPGDETSALTVSDYARYALLPIEVLKGFGLTDGPDGVLMPYGDEDGQLLRNKVRARLTAEGKTPKTWWEKNADHGGQKSYLYGRDRLGDIEDHVIIAEGESDCQALWHCGFPAVGAPGHGIFKAAWAAYVGEAKTAYVLREPDGKLPETVGKAFAESGLPDLPELRVLTLAEGDVLDLWRATLNREQFGERIQAAMKEAEPKRELPFCTADKAAIFVSGVNWLWQDWIPRGHLSVLAGDPGVGKSAFALRLVRSETEPTDWPDGTPGPDEPRTALYCDTEASQAFLLHRIETWGLPASRILLPGTDGMGHLWLDDERSPAAVRELAASERIRLVVVDSLRSGFRGDENSSEIAEMMNAWAELARDLDLSVLLVHHLRKGERGKRTTKGLEDLRGSSALGAAVRSVILLDTPDRHSETIRVRVAKLNFAPKPDAIGFEITATGLEITDAPREPKRAEVLDDAEGFLREALASGRRPREELVREAAAQDITESGLERARRSLGAVAMRDPDDKRRSLWGLPASPHEQKELGVG